MKNKKIIVSLLVFFLCSLFFFAFASDIGDLRWDLQDNGIPNSGSQMKVEIIRDGVVINSKESSLTYSDNFINGIPDDIVFNPPTINAKVGDVVRVSDISTPNPLVTRWDFQRYKDGQALHTNPYYDSSPFPYEITIKEAGKYDYYLNVYNGSTWSGYGDYRSIGTWKGHRMWWYFTSLSVNAKDEPDPFVIVSGNINPNPSSLNSGVAKINIENNSKIENLRVGEKIEAWELQITSSDGSINKTKIFNPSSQINVSNMFSDISITKNTTFTLRGKVTTSRGVFEGVTFLNAQIQGDEAPPIGQAGIVKASGRIDSLSVDKGGYVQNGVAFLTYTYPEYTANVPKVVKIKIDGSSSTSSPFSIKDYYLLMKKNNNSWSHDSSHILEWQGSSSTEFDMVIKPEDVQPNGTVNIVYRIGARDTEGNTNYFNDNEEIVRVSVVYRNPEVDISLPILFLPKSFTDISTFENKITWEYNSPDNIPLDHYEVSLKNITESYSNPEIVIDNENFSKNDSLVVEGNENESFLLTVTAFDTMGNKGEAIAPFIVSDMKATPSFTIDGARKMFKEIRLDGLDSLNYTNEFLHKTLFETDFTSDKSYFVIEPIDEGLSVNDILAINKEVIDNAVIIKGNPQPSLRFDKAGNYKIGYTLWNGFRQSDFVWKEIFIAPELYPILNFNVDSPLVLRDPNNSLKSEFGVTFEYQSLDDEINLLKTRLLLSYDRNNDENFNNDGADSNMMVNSINDNLNAEISVVSKSFTPTGGFVKFVSDNLNKNFLGKILFNFIVVEEMSVPNYEVPPQIPVIGDIETNTFNPEETVKTVLIDNNAPDFTISIGAENNVEIWLFEAGGIDFNSTTASSLLQSLKFYNINATIYYEDGEVIKKIIN